MNKARRKPTYLGEDYDSEVIDWQEILKVNSKMGSFFDCMMSGDFEEQTPGNHSMQTPAVDQSRIELQKRSHSVSSLKRGEQKNYRASFSDENFRKNFGLRKIVGDQKTKMLVNQFKQKINRNIPSSSPIEEQVYSKHQPIDSLSFLNKNGMTIPAWFQVPYQIISLVLIALLSYFMSLGMIFNEAEEGYPVLALQITGCIFFALQILLSSVTIKTIHGKKLSTINEIFGSYFVTKFPLDLLGLLAVVINCAADKSSTPVAVIKLLVLLKFKQFFQKLGKIESLFSYSFKREKYIALIKIFAVNFIFAHILSILMLSMRNFQSSQSWLEKAQINFLPWNEQYAWAFYWGTTTMLTVGFGDISPANYKEALCLSCIETISCIVLAYTINCVGSLISSLRAHDIQKEKNLTTMRRLTEQNGLSQDLQRKVCHYIKDTDKIKKKFQFEDDKKFVASLPTELKSEFYKESNKRTFNNLFFFQNLTEKSLLKLAEQIHTRIAHPEQVIFKAKSEPRVQILQEGRVGYCTISPKSMFDQTIFNEMASTKRNPAILHLLFFKQDPDPKFLIKSLGYSIVSEIDIDKVKEILKVSSTSDFENYCQTRDESKHRIDEFQVLVCQYCKSKHSKIACPKLHYIPLKQVIILKYLNKFKTVENKRMSFARLSSPMREFSALKFRKEAKNFQKLVFGASLESQNIENQLQNNQKMYYSKKKTTLQQNLEIKFNQKLYSNIDIYATTQLQRKLISLLELKQRSEQGKDELIVDKIHNYRFYFTIDNPNLLQFQSLRYKRNFRMRNQVPKSAQLPRKVPKDVSKQTIVIAIESLNSSRKKDAPDIKFSPELKKSRFKSDFSQPQMEVSNIKKFVNKRSKFAEG